MNDTESKFPKPGPVAAIVVMAFELVMALEEEFGVEIPSEDLEKIATVGDVVEYLKNKGVEM